MTAVTDRRHLGCRFGPLPAGTGSTHINYVKSNFPPIRYRGRSIRLYGTGTHTGEYRHAGPRARPRAHLALHSHSSLEPAAAHYNVHDVRTQASRHWTAGLLSLVLQPSRTGRTAEKPPLGARTSTVVHCHSSPTSPCQARAPFSTRRLQSLYATMCATMCATQPAPGAPSRITARALRVHLVACLIARGASRIAPLRACVSRVRLSQWGPRAAAGLEAAAAATAATAPPAPRWPLVAAGAWWQTCTARPVHPYRRCTSHCQGTRAREAKGEAGVRLRVDVEMGGGGGAAAGGWGRGERGEGRHDTAAVREGAKRERERARAEREREGGARRERESARA